MVAAEADQRIASLHRSADIGFDQIPWIAGTLELDVTVIDDAGGQIEAGFAPRAVGVAMQFAPDQGRRLGRAAHDRTSSRHAVFPKEKRWPLRVYLLSTIGIATSRNAAGSATDGDAPAPSPLLQVLRRELARMGQQHSGLA